MSSMARAKQIMLFFSEQRIHKAGCLQSGGSCMGEMSLVLNVLNLESL